MVAVIVATCALLPVVSHRMLWFDSMLCCVVQ